MNVWLLYKDELKGYYKSKIMIILWVGLPALVILMRILYIITPNTVQFYDSFELFAIFIISGLAGALAAVILGTSITSEKNKHVYDLFLIRPVKRYEIILSKYFAVFTCLVLATVFSYSIVNLIDLFYTGPLTLDNLNRTWQNIVITLSIMSVSCSIGILLGMLLSSIIASAILSLYIGEQALSIFIIGFAFFTVWVENIFGPINDPNLALAVFCLILSAIVTTVFLMISILVFNKKQL